MFVDLFFLRSCIGRILLQGRVLEDFGCRNRHVHLIDVEVEGTLCPGIVGVVVAAIVLRIVVIDVVLDVARTDQVRTETPFGIEFLTPFLRQIWPSMASRSPRPFGATTPT